MFILMDEMAAAALFTVLADVKCNDPCSKTGTWQQQLYNESAIYCKHYLTGRVNVFQVKCRN